MKIAVATFIYPSPHIRDYARACLKTLARQTYKDFSLFVFNDGLTDVVSLLPMRGPQTSVVELKGNPADIRRQGILYLRNSGFDAIVFADIDDLFEENRVEIAVEMIACGVDIVINELVLFGEGLNSSHGFLQGRLKEQALVKLGDIGEGNCFGMTNTAIRISAVPDVVFESINVMAFDWFLYTHMLISGAVSKFTSRAVTNYRQHGANIAPIYNCTDLDILRALKIKRRHFEIFYPDRAEGLLETENWISQGKEARSAYCMAVKAVKLPQPFWWESIKTRMELAL